MAATHQGTCPICHRVQKIVRGAMAKHGFRRPNGWHAETAGCWGSYRAPWETEAGRKVAELYIASVLNPAAADKRDYAARIDAGTEKALYFSHYRQTSITVTPEGVTATRSGSPVPAAAEGWETELKRRAYTAEWQNLSTWDRARQTKATEIRRIADQIETEAKFLQRQINGWKPAELTAVAQAADPLPFPVKEGEVLVVREARAGMYGQTRFEVKREGGWVRVSKAALFPMFRAGTARWQTAEEREAAKAARLAARTSAAV